MLPQVNFKELLLLLLRKRRRFRVSGHSMEPVLYEGDEVLLRAFKKRADSYDRKNLRAGEIETGGVVVAEHPHRPGFLLVKQWDGKGLKSLCHQSCSVEGAVVLGVATSVF